MSCGGYGEDDRELRGPAVRRDAVDEVLVGVAATDRWNSAATCHQEELIRTDALRVRPGDLEHVEHQLDLADVVVHPVDEQVAHRLEGDREGG